MDVAVWSAGQRARRFQRPETSGVGDCFSSGRLDECRLAISKLNRYIDIPKENT
jgi:hypothetical protein